MKTIILDEPGRFRLDDTERPTDLTAGEGLVNVCKVDICGTDLHAYRGQQPFLSYPWALAALRRTFESALRDCLSLHRKQLLLQLDALRRRVTSQPAAGSHDAMTGD